ncbi:hypothetical protein QBC42DRAFT_230113 [Cladorrhinum samala]|uniref:Nephrocystin 3-like N-terminal domain-containing protein n=1 Tax=Cladorrhinum samala TaxID=585594 RepID=A0AAV9HLC8_9PEZI|nr:hypothetical protein QBC42DRAFT_230113 [Cladorrhinum samala]
MLRPIFDTGISIVYEPEEPSTAVVDIVIVHGLQGHPYKTWAFSGARPQSRVSDSNPSPSEPQTDKGKGVKTRLRQILPLGRRKPTDCPDAQSSSHSHNAPPQGTIFWPAEFLPKDCPNSRILVYGYDSKVTKYMAGPTNKNTILSYSKDLLYALERETTAGRPLIFVAHSLGGIVVKEMLSRSSASPTDSPGLRSIVESTAAVIFLGTPHRGSPDLAAMGELMRSMISALRVETTSAILDALGLRTTDLERAQETFSQLWHQYKFQVKTFQEGLGLTGINLGVLGNKVVPDYSSLIGDHRERAETLQANHMDMCRFGGASDPNYRKVAGELRSIYLSINQSAKPNLADEKDIDHSAPKPTKHSRAQFSEDEEAFLRTLWFPNANTRFRELERPADNTGGWLFDHPDYQKWAVGEDIDTHKGLLLLRGQPGAGKSTLMAEAVRRSGYYEQAYSGAEHLTAAFFFNARGGELEHSVSGQFRSLLYQLLPHYRQDLHQLTRMWKEGLLGCRENGWAEAELRSMFTSLVNVAGRKRIFVFIDALDECDDEIEAWQLALFWRQVTNSANKLMIQLNVCLSSRHFPYISLTSCLEISVDDHNQHDIQTYVDQRISLAARDEIQWESLKTAILAQSSGVFLWAVLVVDDVLRSWDAGEDVAHLYRIISEVPRTIKDLYAKILGQITSEERLPMVRLFQWATLATKPLRLHEWHHIMAFILDPKLTSLSAWRKSPNFTSDDGQLEKKIRNISKGLVEVRKPLAKDSHERPLDVERLSISAGAGSLDFEHGETRVVQVIHESVREFFLEGLGFSWLVVTPLAVTSRGQGHLSIMGTCLDYINIKELDALVDARSRMETTMKKIPKLASGEPSTSDSEHVPISAQCKPSPLPGDAKLSDDKILSGSQKGTPYSVAEKSREPQSQFDATSAKVDIISWLLATDMTGDCSDGHAIWIPASAPKATDSLPSLAAAQSQQLEDYPALLSYTLANFFTHALLAQKGHADPTSIIDRLYAGGWNRWRLLKEDVPATCTLLAYVQQKYGHLDARKWGRYDVEAPVDLFSDNRTANGLSRRGSVASFSSAGSHQDSPSRNEFQAVDESDSCRRVPVAKQYSAKRRRGESPSREAPAKRPARQDEQKTNASMPGMEFDETHS